MAREEIQLLLTSSSESYTPGSNIEGQIAVTINESASSQQGAEYTRITVSLVGKVDVYFTSGSPSNERHYQENNIFLKKELVVWNKQSSSESAEYANTGRTIQTLTNGRYVFPFSFHLQNDDSTLSLPSSLDSRDGKIKYTIEAKLARLGGNGTEVDAAATFTRLIVRGQVDINRSDLLAPRSAQKEGTVGCFGRGPITVTVTIPRCGYCIVIDEIPVQVIVEPSPGQQLQTITASLIQRVTSTAQNQPCVLQQVISRVTNRQMPRKGVSFTWNVPPLSIPDSLELTLTNCSLVRLGYFIRIEYTGQCIDVQCIDLPIVIGNVPLVNPNSGGLSAASSMQASQQQGLYEPVLTLSDKSIGYHPPPIPRSNVPGDHKGSNNNHHQGENAPLLQN